ncbi:MAG: helix-turn-helix transcriptional regulator [Chloroflexota bacterium]
MQAKGEVIIQNNTHEVFLKLLKQFRHRAKMSQKELANKLNKPQSFVSKYESGERRLDILELRAICNALGTSLVNFVQQLENELNRQPNNASE